MRQHQLGGHIADRPDARDIGSHALINLDGATLIDLDAELFQPQTAPVGAEADCYQRLIGFDGLLSAFAANNYLDAGLGGLYRQDFMPGQHIDFALFKLFCQQIAHFSIFQRSDARQHFDKGNFGAVGVPNGREFKADRPGADDHHRFWLFFLHDGFKVGDDFLAVDLPCSRGCNAGSGGDDNVFGFQTGCLAIIIGHRYRVPGSHFSRTGVDINVVFLHQEPDPLHQAIGDLPAAFNGSSKVQLQVIDGEAKFLAALAQGIGDVGILQQRF